MIRLTLLLTLLAPPALACPTRVDLEGPGITVRYSDGARVEYSLSGPNTVLEINRFADPARDFWLESLYGVYPLTDGEMQGGLPDRRFTATSGYSVPLEDLPEPTAGMLWAGEATDIDGQGVELGQSYFKIQAGSPRRVQLGECSYSMLPVDTLIKDSEGGFSASLDYVPSLGIGMQTKGGALGALFEFYLPVSIEVTGAGG